MNKFAINNAILKELSARYYRESKNVNFGLMLNSTLVFVGLGASTPVIEQLVRLAIKRLHIFDPDTVEKKNLLSQSYRDRDIDLKKEEATKHNLEDVEFEKGNPDLHPIEIFVHGDFLKISDNEIERIIQNEREEGREIIFIVTTDYHPPDARANRIALKYKVPVFWVSLYRMGMAGEIIFYVPDYDLPCYHCITKTRYIFFNKNRLTNHLKGDFSGSGRSLGLPMAAYYIDAILGHLIIGFIHRNIEENQHGKLIRRLLNEKRNFIQCQLDPDYLLNDSEDIFSQIQGPDLIAFNTIFQQETRKTDCLDCSSIAINSVWKNTDYTQENYRNALETFSMREAKLSSVSDYVHPLIHEYKEFFPLWERAQVSSILKAHKPSEIIIERNGKLFGTISLKNMSGAKSIRRVKPGNYVIRLNTEHIIWQDELDEQELIWTAAFPGQALNLAADTGEMDTRTTREIKLLDGDLIIRVFPEIESGRLEFDLKNPYLER